jgi:hypothetical protein
MEEVDAADVKNNIEDAVAESQSFRFPLEQLSGSFPLCKVLPAPLEHSPRAVETEDLPVGWKARYVCHGRGWDNAGRISDCATHLRPVLGRRMFRDHRATAGCVRP